MISRPARRWIHIAGKTWIICYLCLVLYVLSGCQGILQKSDEMIDASPDGANSDMDSYELSPDEMLDLDYTLCDAGQLPKELTTIIENKKDQPFRMCYQNRSYTYLVVGYGIQQRGGCEAVIDRLYLMQDGVHMDTNLVGERGSQIRLDEVTYPYVAIRLEKMDVPVIYE
ncbi:MAG: protease complex subunit PrcB family protein [Lachnospiraceae bacterium]|nr:protease complex subunit PrcB family protein [Lachnospiraceae bacterium]